MRTDVNLGLELVFLLTVPVPITSDLSDVIFYFCTLSKKNIYLGTRILYLESSENLFHPL